MVAPTLMNVFDAIPGVETFVVRHSPMALAMIRLWASSRQRASLWVEFGGLRQM